MAGGTPVIAHDSGSVPEVIDDGVTGFICDSLHVAAAALERVAPDGRTCRERVASDFDASINVQRHEVLYRSTAPIVSNPTLIPSPSQAAGRAGK